MGRFRSLFLPFMVAAAVVCASVSPSGAADQPSRIVSLSPTATETLFAIGAGKHVIAVDNQSNHPASAPHTSLSGYRPNVEAIAGYRPDLVVMSSGAVADQLRALGIEVLVEPAAKSLADAYRQIRAIGRATSHRGDAARVVRRMRSEIAAKDAAVPKRRHRPTAFYEIDSTLYSADSSTFIGQLLERAGLDNVADRAPASSSGYPQLSAEFLVQADPDVIFLADTKCCQQSASTVAARPGFAQLMAVRKAHVVELDDDIASRWGPRVVVLYRTIVDATKSL